MSHPLVPLLQIRTFYLVDGITHRMNNWVYPVDPDLPPGHPLSGIELYTRTGSTVTWQDEDANFYDVIQDLHSDETDFIRNELWRYDVGSSDGVFIRADAMGGSGTVVTPPVLASESIYTGRTSSGRIMRLTLEETVAEPGETTPWISAAFPSGYLLDYMVSADCIICDREGGFLIAGMHRNIGQNEAVFKKRYRPNN